MSSLVTINNGTAVTTSLAIAEGTEVQHKNVIDLIRTYLEDLEEFGKVAFQTRPRSEGQHGGGNTEYAVLNEQQSTLILTYMRNSDIVRAFKKRLVKAFFELANQHKSKSSLPSIANKVSALRSIAAEMRRIKGVDEQVVAACFLTSVAKETGIDTESFRASLPGKISSDTGLLIPSDIGEKLNLSAREVNILLENEGYQERLNGKWVVTSEGLKFSEMIPYASKNGHTDYQIKWKPSIISLLDNALNL